LGHIDFGVWLLLLALLLVAACVVVLVGDMYRVAVKVIKKYLYMSMFVFESGLMQPRARKILFY